MSDKSSDFEHFFTFNSQQLLCHNKVIFVVLKAQPPTLIENSVAQSNSSLSTDFQLSALNR